jgi:hypothetical protein
MRPTSRRILKTIPFFGGNVYIDARESKKWYEISCKYAGTIQVMACVRTLNLAIATAEEVMKMFNASEVWIR